MTIKSVDQTITDKYYDEIKLIVRSLGHKACFISDESLISDFLPCFGRNWKERREVIIKKAKKRIRVDIKHNDKITVVAKRLRRKGKNNNE